MWGAHCGHGGGGGLAEALKGGLLAGGVVRSAVFLLLLLLVGAHGLQSQLFPAAHMCPSDYRWQTRSSGQEQRQQHDTEACLGAYLYKLVYLNRKWDEIDSPEGGEGGGALIWKLRLSFNPA